MQILTDNKIVVFKGTIEKGIYEADPSRELYRITDDDNVYYAVTEGFEVHEVDELPSDFEPMKYCYTEEEGFYENPNKPLLSDSERIEKLEFENAELREEVDLANSLLLDLTEMIIE